MPLIQVIDKSVLLLHINKTGLVKVALIGLLLIVWLTTLILVGIKALATVIRNA
jgi:hypothetical protein